jgi:DNA-binding PadR family transcriptional regulator
MLLVGPNERYGLELVEASAGNLKRGTIYVTLARMEEKGLVCSRRESTNEASSVIPRRLYKPTGFGCTVLRAHERYTQEVVTAGA